MPKNSPETKNLYRVSESKNSSIKSSYNKNTISVKRKEKSILQEQNKLEADAIKTKKSTNKKLNYMNKNEPNSMSIENNSSFSQDSLLSSQRTSEVSTNCSYDNLSIKKEYSETNEPRLTKNNTCIDENIESRTTDKLSSLSKLPRETILNRTNNKICDNDECKSVQLDSTMRQVLSSNKNAKSSSRKVRNSLKSPNIIDMRNNIGTKNTDKDLKQTLPSSKTSLNKITEHQSNIQTLDKNKRDLNSANIQYKLNNQTRGVNSGDDLSIHKKETIYESDRKDFISSKTPRESDKNKIAKENTNLSVNNSNDFYSEFEIQNEEIDSDSDIERNPPWNHHFYIPMYMKYKKNHNACTNQVQKTNTTQEKSILHERIWVESQAHIVSQSLYENHYISVAPDVKLSYKLGTGVSSMMNFCSDSKNDRLNNITKNSINQKFYQRSNSLKYIKSTSQISKYQYISNDDRFCDKKTSSRLSESLSNEIHYSRVNKNFKSNVINDLFFNNSSSNSFFRNGPKKICAKNKKNIRIENKTHNNLVFASKSSVSPTDKYDYDRESSTNLANNVNIPPSVLKEQCSYGYLPREEYGSHVSASEKLSFWPLNQAYTASDIESSGSFNSLLARSDLQTWLASEFHGSVKSEQRLYHSLALVASRCCKTAVLAYQLESSHCLSNPILSSAAINEWILLLTSQLYCQGAVLVVNSQILDLPKDQREKTANLKSAFSSRIYSTVLPRNGELTIVSQLSPANSDATSSTTLERLGIKLEQFLSKTELSSPQVIPSEYIVKDSLVLAVPVNHGSQPIGVILLIRSEHIHVTCVEKPFTLILPFTPVDISASMEFTKILGKHLSSALVIKKNTAQYFLEFLSKLQSSQNSGSPVSKFTYTTQNKGCQEPIKIPENMIPPVSLDYHLAMDGEGRWPSLVNKDKTTEYINSNIYSPVKLSLLEKFADESVNFINTNQKLLNKSKKKVEYISKSRKHNLTNRNCISEQRRKNEMKLYKKTIDQKRAKSFKSNTFERFVFDSKTLDIIEVDKLGNFSEVQNLSENNLNKSAISKRDSSDPMSSIPRDTTKNLYNEGQRHLLLEENKIYSSGIKMESSENTRSTEKRPVNMNRYISENESLINFAEGCSIPPHVNYIHPVDEPISGVAKSEMLHHMMSHVLTDLNKTVLILSTSHICIYQNDNPAILLPHIEGCNLVNLRILPSLTNFYCDSVRLMSSGKQVLKTSITKDDQILELELKKIELSSRLLGYCMVLSIKKT